MAVWAISDFHLSLSKPYVPGSPAVLYKPMSVFGGDWEHHTERLYAAFTEYVSPEDTVFIPGDISWAMNAQTGAADFAFLGSLPGRLVISRGNHDYWWDTKSKAQAAMPPNVTVIQNEAYAAEGLIVAATRGWYTPGSADYNAEAEKLYRRELIRLELSLQSAAGLGRGERVVMLHFPPVNDKRDYNEMIELMQKYDVRRCFYGHLHGVKSDFALSGKHWGIEFALISSDYLGHKPLRIK